MNRVFLSGNLTRDPEVRYTQTGKAFARMGIAVRRSFSKDKEAVDFFNLVAWEKTAEFCGRYLTKGSRVLVEGRLQTSSYENKDGVKVNAVDVIADNIEFASSKRADSGDDGGYRRPSRFNDDDDYQRDDYRKPERDNRPSKKPDDEFISDPTDLEDPPF
ncbi:MAG: single-stranded DNA-binding protein [Selenomonadaceae bacterium]|nr:single-stranded DNA-binding protein [Selenomonadaceae bacterium]